MVSGRPLTTDQKLENPLFKMDEQKILEFAHAKLTRNDFKDEIRSFTNCLCKIGSSETD